MSTLRYGIIGGGFVTLFHMRAMAQVRGIEVAGLVSRSRPERAAQFAREHHLGNPVIYDSIGELVKNVDVVCIFSPNFVRVETVEQIVEAIKQGATLKGVICEKPLARNLREARRLVDLIESTGVTHAYFENQLHMKTMKATRFQLRRVMEQMGPPVLARSSEEHSGPHNGWFWDPTLQGGGVLSDMGCHCLAVAWYALTPIGKPVDYLRPVKVSADVGLLKWGQPKWRQELMDRFGVDYSKTPAEDYATGVVTFQNPDTGQLVKGQFANSWMYEKQGLKLGLEGIGPGYAFEMNTLKSPLELFIGDVAADAVADAEAALEKSTASRGLLAVQPNEADLYGYTDENEDAYRAFVSGGRPMLDWHYGLEIVRLTMAAYMSAETGRVVDLTDDATLEELETYVPLIQQGKGHEVLGVKA